MGSAVINWGDRSSGGSGPPPPSEPNVTVVTGALNEEVPTPDVEVVVGGFVFDPTLFGTATITFRLYGTVVDPNGQGADMELRLYDRGAPGTPIPGTLIVAAGIAVTNVPVVQDVVGIGGSLVAAQRMYELRVLLTNTNADPDCAALVRWGGLEVT